MPKLVRLVFWAVGVGSGLSLLAPVAALADAEDILAVDIDLVEGAAWITYSNGHVEARPLDGSRVTPPSKPTKFLALAPGEAIVELVPTWCGYWLVTSAGRVIPAGEASFLGDLAEAALDHAIVASAATTSGDGYYMMDAEGEVFTFGDAEFYGSVPYWYADDTGSYEVSAFDHATTPFVSLAITEAGYWLLAADGTVYAFGDAHHHGSIQDVVNDAWLAGHQFSVEQSDHDGAPFARDVLSTPIVDFVPSLADTGYFMLASDGGTFSFGQAQAHESLAGQTNSPVIASDATSSGDGYTVLTVKGVVYEHGSLWEPSRPGDCVRVRMAQAGRSTGYFQAELYRLLLEELGYGVTGPSKLELSPKVAYPAMALGYIDFWANSWYPDHLPWLATELPDGSLVDDHVSPIGAQLMAGNVQGFLIERTFGKKHGIETLDDLDNNAAAIAEYDKTDARPGNGLVDLLGCPDGWTCSEIIDSMIEFSGWENITQVKADYDAMFNLAVISEGRDIPFVIYSWGSSAYRTQLDPQTHVYWLGVERVLDDSNPLGINGGHEWDQRPGTVRTSQGSCPSEFAQKCQLGWISSDVLVTARDQFLSENPAARQLFEDVVLSRWDVQNADYQQSRGKLPKDEAAGWIAWNRSTVDAWLARARAAAGMDTVPFGGQKGRQSRE